MFVDMVVISTSTINIIKNGLKLDVAQISS